MLFFVSANTARHTRAGRMATATTPRAGRRGGESGSAQLQIRDDYQIMWHTVQQHQQAQDDKEASAVCTQLLEALALRFGISCFKFGFRVPVPDDFTHVDLPVDDEAPFLSRELIAGSDPAGSIAGSRGRRSPSPTWHNMVGR